MTVGLLSFCVLLALGILPAHAANIQEVRSSNGVRAWLVEDHKLPLIAMKFAFRGGVEQDPAGKQGLANLTMSLLTEGAGPYDAAAFQQQLADHSIAMNFSAGRDALDGSLKTLSTDRDKAFELLHLALAAPRFDQTAIERLRSRQLAQLRSQLGNPDWQARYALFQRIFGAHPYGQRRFGSTRTLAAITQTDIKNFAAAHLARGNLIVSVAGDISPAELAKVLDTIFGDLPKQAHLAPMAEVAWPPEPATLLVPREGTQTEFLFAIPGPKRSDPDWYAAEIANYILGGGGFASRLMQDVRDRKGLTYGIGTSLSPSEHSGVIAGEMAADNPKTGQAWDIVLDTMHRFYEDGVTGEEIQAAKDYLTGALPLAMTSTDRIAGVLLEVQLDRLGRDYLARRNDIIRGVATEDVNRVIKRWFDPDGLTLSMVGKPEDIEPTMTRELTRD